MQQGAERGRVETLGRLENGLRQAGDWYLWGPYVSERQWGTVREDYSAHGTAWEYLPHDHARSRAYRWGEDGLAGFCDVEQRLCLGLALWNGRDPILKERIFGLTGNQGNHGEDAKEYWWYLDATPSHSWNRWRYHYPQAEFPYARLVEENAGRAKHDPEFELLDTGIFDDDRYWIVEAHYAKADAIDVLLTRPGHERRARTRTRSTCSRPPGTATPGPGRSTRKLPSCVPRRRGSDRDRAPVPRSARARTPTTAPDGDRARAPLLRQRDERRAPVRDGRRVRRTRRTGSTTTSSPACATVNPGAPGTKAAFHYRVTVAAGARRSSCGCACGRAGRPAIAVGGLRRRRRDARRDEADEFYAELTPSACTERRGERDAPGVRRDAVGQAAVLLRRPAVAHGRPDRSRRRPTPATAAGTSAGSTSRRSTSCRCPTRGSTRGSPRGTWRSTAWRSRTSTPRSRSTS